MATNIKNVFSPEVFHVHADGSGANEVINMHLDKTSGHFWLTVPTYIADRANGGEARITAPSVVELADEYEAAMDRYQRWRLASQAQPMLMLTSSNEEGYSSRNIVGAASLIMCLQPVYVYRRDASGKLTVFQRTNTSEKITDFSDMGEQMNIHDLNTVFFPDIPEVRAKAAALINSVDTAATILVGLASVPDDQKLAAFMNIGEAVPPASAPSEKKEVPQDDPEEEL